MAVTDGVSGYGTTIGYADTLGGAATLIATLMKVTPPKSSVKKIDLTNSDSPDQRAEFIPGLITEGDLIFDLIYSKARRGQLDPLVGVMKYWTVTYPDGSTDTFMGFISERGQEVPYDDKITCSVSVCVSGKVTFTAAA